MADQTDLGGPYTIQQDGDNIRLDIERSLNFMAIRGDMTAVWLVPNGDISISVMAFEGRTVALRGKIVAAPNLPGGRAQETQAMDGAPVLFELASVRLPPEAAVHTALTTLRQLLASGAVQPAPLRQLLNEQVFSN